MRWTNLLATPTEQSTAELPLGVPHATARTFDTPQFKGMTFYEVHAKSIINQVPGQSAMPFRWTINPYRGCSHKCTYCFARPTHTYLGLNSGEDFDQKIVVKVNAGTLLRKELTKASWRGEAIAMGTNVDPYQRAEGKYRLMRDILGALVEHRNPFSILTKGALVLRDLDLLRAAAEHTQVRVSFSIGFVDRTLWRAVEAGTPSPAARLGVCRSLTEAGINCGVLMAPILPYLTDSDEQLEATVSAIAAAGATSITPLVLHLRPGVREWFMTQLRQQRPEVISHYEKLYRDRAYAPDWYTRSITEKVRDLSQAHGISGRRGWRNAGKAADFSHRVSRPIDVEQEDTAKQLSLL
ncbi:MAG: radical SAM protein [Corynebacteriales bacterium]|nr:radical SAM protein [Mycobacteriales bacterium]